MTERSAEIENVSWETSTSDAAAVEEVDGNKPLSRQLKQKCKL